MTIRKKYTLYNLLLTLIISIIFSTSFYLHEKNTLQAVTLKEIDNILYNISDLFASSLIDTDSERFETHIKRMLISHKLYFIDILNEQQQSISAHQEQSNLSIQPKRQFLLNLKHKQNGIHYIEAQQLHYLYERLRATQFQHIQCASKVTLA